MSAIPFPDFVCSILAVYDGPGHATRTRTKMRRVLALVHALGVASTADLTTELAARFVRDRSGAVSPNTVRGDLAYLAAACTYAVEEGWLERLPRFRRVRPRPAPPALPKCHTVEQVGRVLALLRSRSETWTGGRLHALAATIAYAALRRDEALTLRQEDVSLATGLLAVSARTRRKTFASAASVPICPELADVLRDWLPRCGSEWVFPGARGKGPWTGGACGTRPCDLIRQAGEEVGVEGLTLQSLRHAWATWARRRWGLSALQVQEVLRHTSPRTQELYLRPDPDPMAIVRAVAGVSYRCP
jgi:integrase